MNRLSAVPGVVLVSIAAAMWGLDGLIRKPLSHWKPKGAPAKAIDAVADEVLARVARLRDGSKEVAA